MMPTPQSNATIVILVAKVNLVAKRIAAMIMANAIQRHDYVSVRNTTLEIGKFQYSYV